MYAKKASYKYVPGVKKVITPIQRENTSLLIYNQILYHITSGEWPDGMKLPSEKELAEQFGVSRAPVREALQRLKAMQLVVSQQGSGSFVTSGNTRDLAAAMLSSVEISEEKIAELVEFRKLIEPYCVSLVAKSTSQEEIASLAPFAPPVETLAANKDIRDHLFDLDALFHKRIIELTHNSIFISLYEMVTALRHMNIEFFIRARMDHADILTEHYNIYTAIVEGDAEKAEKLMYAHLNEVYSFMADSSFQKRFGK